VDALAGEPAALVEAAARPVRCCEHAEDGEPRTLRRRTRRRRQLHEHALADRPTVEAQHASRRADLERATRGVPTSSTTKSPPRPICGASELRASASTRTLPHHQPARMTTSKSVAPRSARQATTSPAKMSRSGCGACTRRRARDRGSPPARKPSPVRGDSRHDQVLIAASLAGPIPGRRRDRHGAERPVLLAVCHDLRRRRRPDTGERVQLLRRRDAELERATALPPGAALDAAAATAPARGTTTAPRLRAAPPDSRAPAAPEPSFGPRVAPRPRRGLLHESIEPGTTHGTDDVHHERHRSWGRRHPRRRNGCSRVAAAPLTRCARTSTASSSTSARGADAEVARDPYAKGAVRKRTKLHESATVENLGHTVLMHVRRAAAMLALTLLALPATRGSSAPSGLRGIVTAARSLPSARRRSPATRPRRSPSSSTGQA